MNPLTRADVLRSGAGTLLSGAALGGAVPAFVRDTPSTDPRFPGVYTLDQAAAPGDGKTDDTAAISRALAQAAAAPAGGIVYVPPGVYRTAGGHRIGPRVQVIGAGVGSTVFLHHGNRSCFVLTAPGVSEQRIGIAECTIVGNGGSGAVGLEFRDVAFGAWARLVRIRDYGAGTAFLLHNFAPKQFTEGVTLLGCSASNNRTAVAFRRSGGTNSFKGFYMQQFACNIPAGGTGFDFGVGGTSTIIVYNSSFHGHVWFDRKPGNLGWHVGAHAILRDGQVWMSGEGPSPTSVSIRNVEGGRVTLFGQWWFGEIPHAVVRSRTKIGPLGGGSLY